jgi:hypothetical protein
MNRWFRWYEGTCEDTKLRMVHRAVQIQDKPDGDRYVTVRNDRVTLGCVIAVWACLLEDAAKVENDGVTTRHFSYISAALDMGDNDVSDILDAMVITGLIANDPKGYQIVAWNKRQYRSDHDPTNAERQRRYRNKRKPLANALLTAPETETETETETEKKGARKRACQLSYEGFSEVPESWKAYCREKRSDLDAEATWLDFRDYWKAQAKPMVDWERTWQRWVRNQRTKPGVTNAQSNGPVTEQWIEVPSETRDKWADETGKPWMKNSTRAPAVPKAWLEQQSLEIPESLRRH